MKELIKTAQLYKTYNNDNRVCVEALKDINLTIYPGEFIAIMGPSGAGKSTLLNVITTIESPTSGIVELNGNSIHSMSDNEINQFRFTQLGFIYQDFNLLDSLTVFENIILPISKVGSSRKEIEKRVAEVSEKLDISELLQKYPIECSGGQQQRIAIARALVLSPKLVVADEPTGNLDTANTRLIMEQLLKINKEGTTIIIVTHDNLVASYSHRVLYLIDGMIEEEIARNNLDREEYYEKISYVSSREMLMHIGLN